MSASNQRRIFFSASISDQKARRDVPLGADLGASVYKAVMMKN